MNKERILIAIIVFLLVTNVTTIITGVVRSRSTENVVSTSSIVPQTQRATFFQEQLGLSDQQRKDFMKYTMQFNRNAKVLTNRMNSLRYKMVDELALPEPGQKNLEKINREIGDLHYQLKMETSDYYINLKGVCDETQKKRLYELFRVMADPLGDINTIRRDNTNSTEMKGRRGVMQNNERN